jgi:hypothetical protein
VTSAPTDTSLNLDASRFTDGLSQWYWARSGAGAYSLVWFQGLDDSGGVTASAYVAKGRQDRGTQAGTGSGPGAVPDDGTVYPVPYGFSSTLQEIEVRRDASGCGLSRTLRSTGSCRTQGMTGGIGGRACGVRGFDWHRSIGDAGLVCRAAAVPPRGLPCRERDNVPKRKSQTLVRLHGTASTP